MFNFSYGSFLRKSPYGNIVTREFLPCHRKMKQFLPQITSVTRNLRPHKVRLRFPAAGRPGYRCRPPGTPPRRSARICAPGDVAGLGVRVHPLHQPAALLYRPLQQPAKLREAFPRSRRNLKGMAGTQILGKLPLLCQVCLLNRVSTGFPVTPSSARVS